MADMNNPRPYTLPHHTIIDDIITDARRAKTLLARLFHSRHSPQDILRAFLGECLPDTSRFAIPAQYIFETVFTTEWLADPDRTVVHLTGERLLSGVPETFRYPRDFPQQFMLTCEHDIHISQRRLPPIFVYYADSSRRLSQSFIHTLQYLDLKLPSDTVISWPTPSVPALYVSMATPYGDPNEGRRMFKELPLDVIDMVLSSETIDAYNSMRGRLPEIDPDPAQAEFDFHVIQLVIALLHQIDSAPRPMERTDRFKLLQRTFCTRTFDY